MPDGGKLDVNFPEKLEPLFHPHRYKCVYGGRGKGGSWGISRALLIKGYQTPLRILCTREIQRTIADSVHQLLKDQISLMGLGAFYHVTENTISGLNGTQFLFAGMRQLDAGKLKSLEGCDIAWVEEAENISKKSWEILIPTIRKDGSEIWVNFNPQLDSDETYVRFIENTPPDTALIQMNWRDNPFFPSVLERERQYLERIDPEAYANVWEGKCRATVDGAIYAGEIQDAIQNKRVRPVPYDPMLKVYTVWDLGWNDRMSIGFLQRLGSEIRWIDFLEDQHRTYDWYAAEIKNKRYNLAKAFLPHDGRHKNAQTGLSAEEILKRLGIDAEAANAPSPVEDGIKAVKMMFRQMYFDDVKCKALFDHLRRYRRSIPVSTNEPQSPVHDEHSHAADMVREACSRARDMVNQESFSKPIRYPSLGVV